ncbi:MAG: hypothetical protein HC853_06235 [Anaerolineae bacterium]|nr:hypothetical protein [Anaerolineae bacterium]
MWRPASLGDTVWEDINHDGIQNDELTGVNGVLVTLLDDEGNVIATTTTSTGGPNNAAGYYTFTNLISDTYSVSFTLPAGYQWTLPNEGESDALDSDGVPQGNVAVTGAYVLNAGESNPTVDQGVWRPASLGNYVWVDDDRDGVQDEPASRGVNGVTVRLLGVEGELISTTVTADDPNGNPGYYTFTNLVPYRYGVEFDLTTLPGGFTVTLRGASGSKDGSDSDADPTTGETEEITLATGESDPTWDMGIWTPASLGDTVWEDYDHDGVQDLNEPPVQGVQVVLYDGVTNAPLLTTTTSVTGFYRFDGLTPSVPYYVGFTLPTGYEFTTQGTNPISALDSNADPVTGKTAPIVLMSGEHNPTLDAGLFRPASLGDYVWLDTNANGQQDESAPSGGTGVNGVTVALLDAAGNVVDTTTTFTGGPNNAAGYYTFTNLISSTYQVRFTAPQQYSITKANVGNDSTDSDGVPQGGQVAQTGPIVLNAGESNPTIDLGLYQPASLGDRVWYDYDADGIQDSTEVTGVVGVQVVLYDALTNQPVATTTTGADGYYSFTALVPGSYLVAFMLPTGYGRSPGDVSGAGRMPPTAMPINSQAAPYQ